MLKTIVFQGCRHPHTNMAKAALNMMTRTSGLEFQLDHIYMTGKFFVS